jgi:serine/threonine protein kinase
MSTEDDQNGSTPTVSVSDAASALTQPSHSPDSTTPTIRDTTTSVASPTVLSNTTGLIGVVIDGRYRVERMIAHGGMGQVFLAKDLQLHARPVVIKLLLEDAYKDPYMLKKFQQEMEALSRIQHPGVIGIIDSGELPDAKPFIVMEYVNGMNLRAQIRSEGMNLERIAEIVKQMGRALAATHEKGIFHRDLKPENIMLQDLGHGEEIVKIIDFGIAKIKQSAIAPTTATTATAGTIGYMAPEQLSAKPVSAAADIYSLGVIAYEMVTGRRPFNPETPFELLEMQRAGVRVQPIDLRPSLPRRAQLAIMKALSFEQSQRYRTIREFTDELARALLDDERTAPAEEGTDRWLRPTIPLPERAQVPGAGSSTANNPPVVTNPNRHTTFDQSAVPPVTRATPRMLFSLNTSWLKISVGLFSFLVLGSALYGLMISTRLSRSPVPANLNTALPPSQYALTYWLTVQKMRDGKPYQDPFQSSGQEIFENGYGFRLNVASPQPGYLYVFNEGATATGDISFTILYPTPKTNGGSARIEGNPPIQTNWNRFGGQPGTEEFWMIWAVKPVPELEAAKEQAFANDKGKVTNAALLKTVREFLIKHSDPKPEVVKDHLKQQTMVRGVSEPVVQLVELEHR